MASTVPARKGGSAWTVMAAAALERSRMVAKTPEPSLPRHTAGVTPFSDSRAIAPQRPARSESADGADGSQALAR